MLVNRRIGETMELGKELGLLEVFCIASGAMISSGIFILPGITFGYGGFSIVFSYFIVGSKAQRTFHLWALVVIVQIVNDPTFLSKWMKAGSKEALRDAVLLANRNRDKCFMKNGLVHL